MSLAEGHSSLHAAQAFLQRDHFRIPGRICCTPSPCQGLHLVRPDQLNHRHETGKAGWAGRKSFDSRSVVLFFKPLTGGLSQNGTTVLNNIPQLPTGSLPQNKVSVCSPFVPTHQGVSQQDSSKLYKSPPPYHPRKTAQLQNTEHSFFS